MNSIVIITLALLASAAVSFLFTYSPSRRSSAAAPAGAAEFADAPGHPVAVMPAKLRIVAGYTAFTEILRAINAGEYIVGATRDDARELGVQNIGTHLNPDFEAILAAAPDIVLLSSRRAELVETLRRKTAGSSIQVYAAHPATVDETLQLIETLGRMTGREAEAGAIVQESRRALERVELALKKKNGPPRTVFVEVRNTPSLLSCGRDSIAFDILRRAGGRAVCDLPGSVVDFSAEALIAANPDFYIQQTGAMNKSPVRLAEHPVLSRLACIRDGRFKTVDEALLSRPGSRTADMVTRMHEWLYTEEK